MSATEALQPHANDAIQTCSIYSHAINTTVGCMDGIHADAVCMHAGACADARVLAAPYWEGNAKQQEARSIVRLGLRSHFVQQRTRGKDRVRTGG
jgi:hypothetical protein